MALPALPEDNTKRYFLDYSHAGVNHTLVVRTNNSVSDAAVISQIDAFLTDMAPMLQTIDVVGLRVAVQGSNVTNPISWTGSPTFGAAAALAVSRPNFLSFTGRGTDGRKVRITVFGRNQSPTDNYRVTNAENAAVGDALAQLAFVTGIFTTISGSQPVWNQYANAGSNAYWQREVRTL